MEDDIIPRATKFFEDSALTPTEQLGFGIHGKVWLARDERGGADVAVKAFERRRDCLQERDVYRRLREEEVEKICGCHVPQMLEYDGDLLIIVMSVVKPPYVLDFAGSQLDERPDFPPGVMEEWMAAKEAQYTEDEWPVVLEILGELESLGIYLTDLSPANVSLVGWVPPEN